MAAFSSSESWQVFINCRGSVLLNRFISHLERALDLAGIKYHGDTREVRSEDVDVHFAWIRQSKISLSIFSISYANSDWCLDELVEIMEQVEKGNLIIIPIFFDVKPEEVRKLNGWFGLKQYKGGIRNRPNIPRWEKALQSVPSKMGLYMEDYRNERELIDSIIASIRRVLALVPPPVNRGGEHLRDTGFPTGTSYGDINNSSAASSYINRHRPFRLNSRDAEETDAEFFGSESRGGGNASGAIDRIVEYIPTDGTENSRDKDTEFPTCKFGANPESSSSDAKTNADLFDRICTNSPMNGKVKPPKIQVFINFRGDQLRNNFVGFLVDALRRSEINVFIDIGEDLNTLFKRIEDSGIAIVVFSSRYTESKWCLEELVKIKERVHQGLLKVLPIFYKVTPTNVKRLKGDFGDHFRDQEYLYESDEPKIKRWKEAIAYVSHKFALTLDEKSSTLEIDFVETVVKEVLKMLQAISKVEHGQSSC